MWNELMHVLSSLDWTPLWISLQTGIIATIICFFLGIGFAYYVYQRKGFLAAAVDGILTLPLVLPPTVAGFLLLYIFSPRRMLGAGLEAAFGIRVVQTWLGCIVAAVVIALPLMYRNAKAAFELVNPELLQVSKTLGLSKGTIFWRILLPVAKPGLLSGVILTFARALGEYGATSMLAGNIPGKTGTISQRIAMVMQNGDYLDAGLWTTIVMGIAFGCIIGLNLALQRRKQKRKRIGQ